MRRFKDWKTMPHKERECLLKQYYENDVFPVDALVELQSIPGLPIGTLDITQSLDYPGKSLYIKYPKNRLQDARGIKRSLVRSVPTKLEFGAFYPTDDRRALNRARARDLLEYPSNLTIDVDLTDYGIEHGGLPPVFQYAPCQHDIKQASCGHCWDMFLRPGARILLMVLEYYFNIRNCVVADSGKKGFHLHALEQDAFYCFRTAESRRQLVQLLNGTELPPELEDQIYGTVLVPLYTELTSKGMFQGSLAPLLARAFKSVTGRSDLDGAGVREQQMLSHIQELGDETATRVMRMRMKMLFWPRVDIQHLLQPRALYKSLFSCHYATGNLCLPVLDLQSYNPATDRVTLPQAVQDPAILRPHIRLVRRQIARAKD